MSELLAPAGGREALIAAVQNGADAVYLGARLFNARRGADNFDEGGLQEAVSYCHARGVRVHVTLNTLVRDGEMAALEAQNAVGCLRRMERPRPADRRDLEASLNCLEAYRRAVTDFCGRERTEQEIREAVTAGVVRRPMHIRI